MGSDGHTKVAINDPTRRSRFRRFIGGWWPLVLIGVVVVLGSIGASVASSRGKVSPPAPATTEAASEPVIVNLGFHRTAQTRTQLITLSTPITDPTQTVSAELESDLHTANRVHDIPADSVAVSVSRTRPDQARVTVVVEPEDLGELQGGVYKGVVRVQGEQSVPLAVVVYDRSSLFFPSIWWIWLGALIGLAARWLNDTGAGMAINYRRWRRIRRYLTDDVVSGLPRSVERMLRDVVAAFRSLDAPAVQRGIDALDTNLTALLHAGHRLQAIGKQHAQWSDSSAAPMPRAIAAPLQIVRNATGRQIERYENADWPWDDTADRAALVADLDTLATTVEDLGDVVNGAFSLDPTSIADLTRWAAAIREHGPKALVTPNLAVQPATIEAIQRMQTAPSQLHMEPPSSRTRPVSPDLLDGAEFGGNTLVRLALTRTSFLLLVASLIAMSLAGYQTQVADKPAFDDGFASMLVLFIWGFAIAIGGITLAGLAGQLGTPLPDLGAVTASTTTTVATSTVPTPTVAGGLATQPATSPPPVAPVVPIEAPPDVLQPSQDREAVLGSITEEAAAIDAPYLDPNGDNAE